VNLTDGWTVWRERDVYRDVGFDGLTYVAATGAGRLSDITHKPEAAELTVFCGAMVGASLGFLGITRRRRSFYGRCRQSGNRRRARNSGDFDETGFLCRLSAACLFWKRLGDAAVSVFKLTKRGGQRASVFLR
jgi:hypothetical protein